MLHIRHDNPGCFTIDFSKMTLTHEQEPESVTDESRLLRLPGELRNMIYEYALLEEDKIMFDRNSCQQPGILCVNRQIRQETASIYYGTNTFAIDCSDFNCATLRFFMLQSHEWLPPATASSKKVYIFYNTTYAVWANVIDWAQRVHTDRSVPVLGSVYGSLPVVCTVERFLLTAKRLRFLPWSVVKEVLEDMKVVSEQVHTSWQ